jgi:hypothetical protein
MELPPMAVGKEINIKRHSGKNLVAICGNFLGRKYVTVRYQICNNSYFVNIEQVKNRLYSRPKSHETLANIEWWSHCWQIEATGNSVTILCLYFRVVAGAGNEYRTLIEVIMADGTNFYFFVG